MGSSASKPVRAAAGTAKRQYPKQTAPPPRTSAIPPRETKAPEAPTPQPTPPPSQPPHPAPGGPTYHSQEQPSGTKSNCMRSPCLLYAQSRGEIQRKPPLHRATSLSPTYQLTNLHQQSTSTAATLTSPPRSAPSDPSTRTQPSPTPAPSTGPVCKQSSPQPPTRRY